MLLLSLELPLLNMFSLVCVLKCQHFVITIFRLALHLPPADIMKAVLLRPAPQSTPPPLHLSSACWDNHYSGKSMLGIYQTEACNRGLGEMSKVHRLCHRLFNI